MPSRTLRHECNHAARPHRPSSVVERLLCLVEIDIFWVAAGAHNDDIGELAQLCRTQVVERLARPSMGLDRMSSRGQHNLIPIHDDVEDEVETDQGGAFFEVFAHRVAGEICPPAPWGPPSWHDCVGSCVLTDSGYERLGAA